MNHGGKRAFFKGDNRKPLRMLPATLDDNDPLAVRFRHFVGQPAFPCVGAKSALAKQQMSFVVGRDITSAWDDLRIYPALFNFAKSYKKNKRLFQSFVAIFRGPRVLDEEQFEGALWERLQSLTDKDSWHGQSHDSRVSADPQSPHFSMSFGGEGFYIIGLHPRASRPARRFFCPAIVFNLHDQFEELRKREIYDGMRGRIAERDMAFSGSVNPMLTTFGEGSEAKQYSGRAVDGSWACPFHR